MTRGEPSQSSFHLVGLTASASSAHSSVGLGPVDGDHPELVVAAAGVDEGQPVGVDRHRALDDVARLERGEDVLARVVVDEVDLAVVGAEHHPRAPVALEHRGLAGPAAAAPRAGLVALGRLGAHAARLAGVAPQHLGRRGDRPLAVVAAGRAAPEREQPRRGEAGRRPGGGRGGGGRRGRARRGVGGAARSRASSASPASRTNCCTPIAPATRTRAPSSSAPRRRRSCRGVRCAGALVVRVRTRCPMGSTMRSRWPGNRPGLGPGPARPVGTQAGVVGFAVRGASVRVIAVRGAAARVGPAVRAGRVIPVRVSPSRPLVAPQRSISTPSRRSGQLKL